VSRLLIVVALTFFMAQATGLAALLESGECRASCEDDGPDGRCPPVCFSCTCCGHVARSLDAPQGVLAPPGSALMPIADLEEQAPPPAEPHDILHVPKRGAA
jgi:hypothetical protein